MPFRGGDGAGGIDAGRVQAVGDSAEGGVEARVTATAALWQRGVRGGRKWSGCGGAVVMAVVGRVAEAEAATAAERRR